MITAVCVLGISIGLHWVNNGIEPVRVNQHQEAEWQAAKIEEENEFETHLPIITIDTEGQKIPGAGIIKDDAIDVDDTTTNGKTRIKANFSVIDLQNGSNNLTDKATLSSLADISYRGNSSIFFDKKSYSIHLVSEDGTENKQEIAGMASHNEWVLNGPFLDRSLLRNYVAMNISGQIMDYAPNVRYCELFVDGEYQGLYLLMESISRGEGRIDIKKPNKNSKVTSYIVRWDREGKGDQELNNYIYYTYQSGIAALDVRYPGKNLITEERMKYINQDISKFEKVLYSYDLIDKRKGYENYIDINAFAEYFIINEFFRNVDAGHYSTFYYKDVRGKLKPCVWDFNNGMDNYAENSFSESGFSMINAPVFNALIKDEKFVTTVVEKYRELRKGVLAESYLYNYIDETNEWLGNAVSRNYEIWGYAFDLSNYNVYNYLTPMDRNYTSHKDAVQQLKSFITHRGNWMDDNIDTLYQYCHESKNANELIR